MAWDRVNFGRILRDIRNEAGLTQEQLAERMGGRDRRRIMVLEQGTAVREPQLAEINLLGRALGIPGAAGKLRAALDIEVEAAAGGDRETARETIRTELAGRFNELLQQLDAAQQTARELARSSDEALFEEHIAPVDLYRTSKPIADAWGDIQDGVIAAREELLRQLKRERSRLGRLLPKSPQEDPVATFRERLFRYSLRCEDADTAALTPTDERDAVQRAIDVIELGTYHLNPRVSHLAMTAKRALRHLFRMWAGLAAPAEHRYFPGPPKAPRKVYDERTQDEATRAIAVRDHLMEALEIAHDTPIPQYVKSFLEKDWAAHERENIEAYGRLYQEMNDVYRKLSKEGIESVPGHRLLDLGGRGTSLV